ncbi:TPA: hypothetical protein SIA33_001433 [Aeromonas salmonicida]|nr:hypothetical protein [Aeromonas salmonicida]
MSKNQKITIVTVVYDKEYPLLLVQARSIVRYVDREFIAEIIWIVNHSKGEQQINGKYFKEAAETLMLSGFKLIIVDREKYGIEGQCGGGWRHQQILKLLIANDIGTEHYFLLDAKNFFNKTINQERLFKNERAISFKWNCSPLMRSHLESSAKSLGCNIDKNELVMPTATPYMMVTSIVKELIMYTDKPFVKFFYENQNITEFFLYFSFLKIKDLVDAHYHFAPQFYATFFTIYPSEENQILAVQRLVESDNVFNVSFHKNRFMNCPPDFKAYIFYIWLKNLLVKDGHECEEIFSAMDYPPEPLATNITK